MPTIDTVVIGAGHAGLAVSRLLCGAGRDHVVLERGRVAERWRTERWDSLHLLTPNWMTRLPGSPHLGEDPEGYLAAAELVGHLEHYASSFAAPVETGVRVERVATAGKGYLVSTDRGNWRARHVVVATGPWGRPHVPGSIHRAHPDVAVVTANRYRNPQGLPPGGVLVVGASSSGMQIADELRRAGRDVTISVGRHTRMPRRYRGMDIFWWLERTGRLARTIDDVPDPHAARREPSMQLVGRNEPDRVAKDLNLASLQSGGVRVTGRLDEVDGRLATFRDDLAATTAASETRMNRFLDAVDRHIDSTGLAREMGEPARPGPVDATLAPSRLDLAAEGIAAIVLATGYRPDHSWLEVPVTEADGAIRQYRGVTTAAGLYVVGQRFQHRRDSGFIDGARHDAHAVVRHLTRGRRTPAPILANGKD
jgi:putative flavoprotein involved in K+ transport